MFSVSVVDHVRLNFGHVVRNYTVHARAAERLAKVAMIARLGVLVLLALSASLIVMSLFEGRGYQLSAAVITSLALIAHTVYVAAGLESRVYAHRSLAHRLWPMCEKYRSLLAEIQDGLVDTSAVLRRRDGLVEQLHLIYEHEFPVDQPGFEGMRQLPATGEEGALGEEQIDQFLPTSARKVQHSSTAGAPVERPTPVQPDLQAHPRTTAG